MTDDRSLDRLSRPIALGLAAGLLVLVLAGVAWTQTDLDGDGLDAASELSLGTDPFRADTDGDQLADGFEHTRDLSPFRQDTDEDSISDPDELTDGTDPRNSDTDGDGLDDARERDAPTHARISDTDGDTLGDGLEVELGTNPVSPDTDRDQVEDPREIQLGANPNDPDTDGDGLDDAQEVEAGPRDCDGDGFSELLEPDDDADRRPDADEPSAHRCDPDVDEDGILDGEEANETCIELADCDLDGLEDATELGTVFDRLDPDTFDVGLLDGVSWAFQQRGQPPSEDADGDGIPDRWEETTGLIEWGGFDPEPGRADMLVEFVRVQGPDSRHLGPGPLTPAFEDVETFFEDEGAIAFEFERTVLDLDEERRPPLIPSSNAEYYLEVLERSRYAQNPYVTTVVLNPQHDASEIVHLGVAPIRGMLAAVDYGAHSEVHFTVDEQPFSISPLFESLIEADRRDVLEASGFDDFGRTQTGDFFLERDGQWTMTWRPFWFATPPVFDFHGGGTSTATRTGLTVDWADLADTIAHELGHTLGLCHTHLPDCQTGLSEEDRDLVGVSTMDPRRQGPRLAFLDSEWAQVETYLACPPQRTIARIAEGANASVVLDAKYAVTLENVLAVNVRECEDRAPVASTLAAVPSADPYRSPLSLEEDQLEPEPTVYNAPAEDALPAPAGRTTQASWIYGLGTVLLAASAGSAAGWIGLRRRG